MILVADSGSTKTDWRLLTPEGQELSFHSEGINPFFHTRLSVSEILLNITLPLGHFDDVSAVYFYGAGCSTEKNVKLMKDGFSTVFRRAEIHILHDLLGAARALYHSSDGIAGILGTGSNACLFENGEITVQLGGAGYILGDEGSGLHIGRKVIRDYINHLMPEKFERLFEQAYPISRQEIVDAVYKKPMPNRFLASFSRFASEHISSPYMQSLVDDAFEKYFDRYIVKFPNYRQHKLRIVGSVGFVLRDRLEIQAKRVGIELERVIKAPIDGLVEYHRS